MSAKLSNGKNFEFSGNETNNLLKYSILIYTYFLKYSTSH